MSCCCDRNITSSPPVEKIVSDNKFQTENPLVNAENSNREQKQLDESSRNNFEEKTNKSDFNIINTANKEVITEEDMDRMSSLLDRLEKATCRLESVSSSTNRSNEHVDENICVQLYDEEVLPTFNEFFSLSEKIGGDVFTQAKMVKNAFEAQRQLILLAGKSNQPNDNDLKKIMEPLSNEIFNVIAFKDKNRPSKLFNHLSAIAESISALGWVSVKPAPAPFVKEMTDAGQFYTNRVLLDYKDKDSVHVSWVKSWMETLNKLQTYVKKNHTTGLTWNSQGGNISSASFHVPPPPGPPPPPEMVSCESGDSGSKSALFADINKGTSVTQGLKKVSDDMKTHKNPELRGNAPILAKSSNVSRNVKPTSEVKKQPIKALQQKKWVVENFENDHNIVIDKTETKQSVYVFKCNNCVIVIKGKVNSIALDSCNKTQIAFDDIIGTFDVVNCQSVKCQVNLKAPTISIDKTDGCQLYLSKDFANTRIVTAKSSEVNISKMENGEFVESAVPEQFVTLWDDKKKKFITTVSDI